MAESIRKARLHHLVSQQPQSPVVMPFRRRSARHRNHRCALLFGRFGRGSRSRAILQCRINASFDTSLPGLADHGGRSCQGLHDFSVLASRCRFRWNSRPRPLPGSFTPQDLFGLRRHHDRLSAVDQHSLPFHDLRLLGQSEQRVCRGNQWQFRPGFGQEGFRSRSTR